MAIKTEIYSINDCQFTRTWSDSGVYIYGGFPEGIYAEAIDPTELNRQYTETEIPLEQEEEIPYEEVFNILLGNN